MQAQQNKRMRIRDADTGKVKSLSSSWDKKGIDARNLETGEATNALSRSWWPFLSQSNNGKDAFTRRLL
jgi:hypothetical protein